MLDLNRIKEAQNNIKTYLAEGLLKKTAKADKNILSILIQNARESFNVAQILFENNYSSLWTIVCSYYSMYYISRAVLYKINYKIEHKISHKITADALIVFIRDKLKDILIEEYEEVKETALSIAENKADELVESFDYERIKRSRLQYNMTEQIKASKAKTSLERAKRFVFEVEKII